MTAIVIPESYLLSMIAAVRVSDTATSRAEVTDLINAAAIDLNRQGVQTIDINEALTKQAIKLYIKANYGYDDMPRYREAYEALSAAMALSGDYESEAGDQDE